MGLFVLVGGWPGSGKSTLARALAAQLRLPLLAWFSYTRPLVATLPGRLVEVRCVVPLEVARARYYARAGTRNAGHHDLARTEEELWGEPSRPLGVGTAIEVDTTTPTDARAIAKKVLRIGS